MRLKKPARYPENKYLALEVFKSGMTLKDLAQKIGYSREAVNNVVNGHYKGTRIIPKLKKELGLKD